jgi:hypothetical protein
MPGSRWMDSVALHARRAVPDAFAVDMTTHQSVVLFESRPFWKVCIGGRFDGTSLDTRLGVGWNWVILCNNKTELDTSRYFLTLEKHDQ